MRIEEKRKMKRRGRRSLSFLMMVILLANTVMPGLGTVMRAEAAEQTAIRLLLNGEQPLAANEVEAPYGDQIELTADGYEGDSEVFYYYLPGDTVITEETEWTNQWTGEQGPKEIGTYYIAYSINDGVNHINIAEFDGRYKFSIVKAVLKSPQTLGWENGSKAVWSKVNQTVTGTTVADSVIDGYEVQLYKDGEAVGKPIATTAVEYDFTDTILKNGEGTYTYSIVTKSKDTEHYLSSIQANVTESAYALKASITKDEGTQSVSPVSPLMLIAGNTEHNSFSASAITKEGISFSAWSISGGATLTAENLSSASTVFTLAAGNPGTKQITIRANTADEILPVITEYTANADGSLSATLTDKGSGIAAYAFSTQTQSAEVTWTEVEVEAQKAVQYEVDKPGTYYVWAKDAVGNVKRSEISYQATEVIYHNYYKNNEMTSFSQFYVGDNSLTLQESVRSGYTFDGWYQTEAMDEEAVTTISGHTKNQIDVYGKWKLNNITFSEQPQGVTKAYDGNEHVLRAAVSNDYGTPSYQWYKDGNPIENATGSEYKVKDVSDSGTYMVKVSLAVDGKTTSEDSESAVVSISKAPLSIKANDREVSYLDAKPEYTVSYNGFAQGEDEKVLEGELSLVCSYKKGDSVGEYPIVLSGYTSDNYEIDFVNGNTKVNPKDVKAAGAKVTVGEIASAIYQGDEIKPEIFVWDNGKSVDTANYEVHYANNKDAGSAVVTVEFKGNYTGSLIQTFEIEQAEFESQVILKDWKYGETASEAAVSTNESGGEVTYYYSSNDIDYTTEKPVDAGEYKVYARIAETKNYKECCTPKISFVISKRKIVLTAGSGSWGYDGNSYSNSSYTTTGSFAGADDFQSVTVTGTITEVGEQDNLIEYSLMSSTNPNNYSIECRAGTLTIYPIKLNAPQMLKWDQSHPGRCEWIAVTKDSLVVHYEVKLYDSSNHCIATETTANTYFDFSDYIKGYSATEGSYYFTVSAKPYDGSAKKNYLESEVSKNTRQLHTVVIQMAKSVGVLNATINGDSSLLLIQGESATLATEAEFGYKLSSPVWTIPAEATGVVTIADKNEASTTIQVSSQIEEASRVTITALSEDIKPVIANYQAVRSGLGSSVTLSATASDSKALAAYAVTTSSTAPEIDSSEWKTLQGTSCEIEESVTEKGTYYVWVKDDSGNVVVSDGISIYEISFAAGIESEIVSMPSVLKIQNSDIVLPANMFTKSQYAFQQWKGSTGYYKNQGVYAANSDDTLVAQWTNEKYNYTVNYYYMDTKGNYSETADESVAFTAIAGTEVSSTDEEVEIEKQGFSLDTKWSDSITVDGEGKELHVYYKRNQYTISYAVTFEGKTETIAVDTYYYGQIVEEEEKPEKVGYTFVGWLYGDSGTVPSTMINRNMSATGYFKKNMVSYKVNCYTENLEGGEYTLYSQSEYQVEHGSNVEADKGMALKITGFSASGVRLSSGAVGGSVPGTLLDSTTGVATAAAGEELNINYYYTRNLYKLTLNVWRGEHIDGTQIYTNEWTISYGEVLDSEEYSTYKQSEWGAGKEELLTGYALADYVNWSTGGAPTVMPAGNVAVSREYVSTTQNEYKIKVYYETEVENQYSPKTEFTFYGNVGTKVTVGDGSDYTVNINNFRYSLLDTFDMYRYKQTPDSVEEGYIRDTSAGEGPLELEVYFEREDVSSTITYYYMDPSSGNFVKLASKSVTDKWGKKYEVSPNEFFYGTGEGTGYTYTKEDMLTTNFCQNGYVLSYVSYSAEGWKTANVKQEEQLSGKLSNTLAARGKYANSVSVYYALAEPEKQSVVDVVYSPAKLKKANDSGSYSVYVEKEKVETDCPMLNDQLKVRIANSASIYRSEYVPGEGNANYPGGKMISGSYQVSNQLNEGMYIATVSGFAGQYYTDGEYLYVENTTNSFYVGNRVSFAFGKDKPGTHVVEQYLQNYKDTHNDSENAETYDANSVGAYVYYNSYGSTVMTKQVCTHTMTFEYGDVYTVTYNLGATTCVDHRYADGENVEIRCDHAIFEQRPGYHIKWYKDSTFTEEAEPFQIHGNTVLYGRYIKDILLCHMYAYYECSEEIQYMDGEEMVTTNFVTKDILDKLDAEKLSQSQEKETVSFVDEEGKTQQIDVTSKKYYYEGELVLIDQEKPVLSYNDVTMKYEDYNREGFYYDNKNVENLIYGYCQSEPVNLFAYFERNENQVTVVNNNSEYENVEPVTYKAGQEVVVQAPKKTGYSFDFWNYYRWDKEADEGAGAWVTWTGAPTENEDGSLSFAMPDYTVKLEAVWKPLELETNVTHYFQNSNQVYDTSRLASMKDSTYISQLGEWIVYYADEARTSLLGVSKVSEDIIYYYSEAEISGEAVSVEGYNLVAAESKIKANTGETIRVGDYILNSMGEMFNYSFTIYQEDKQVTDYLEDNTFLNMPGIKVDYYYSLTDAFKVRIAAKATDGDNPGITFAGAGDYYYGAQAVLKSTIYSGYDLVGWYRARDVLENYVEGSGKDLTEYELKSDISSYQPLSSESQYTCTITKNENWIIVTRPKEAAEASVTVAGKNDYDYGYTTNSTDRVLTATAVIAEGEDASNHIFAYQWYTYEEGSAVKIEDGTSAAYNFPAGKEKGTYTYYCEVTVKRQDNERTKVSRSDDFNIVVNSVSPNVTTNNYNGVYDGQRHSASVTVEGVTTGYTVYYSEEELTEDNYLTGQKEYLSYMDVAVNNFGEVIPRTVYYYVTYENPNYKATAGEISVNITPKRVTVGAAVGASSVFSKVYDGSKEIAGDVRNPGTQAYELAHGAYYAVNGLLAEDAESILDFHAEYNDAHVNHANTILLSDIKVLLDDGEKNHNYAFDKAYSLTLSAYITPKPIEVEWLGKTVDYSAEMYVPEVRIKDKSFPVELSVLGGQVNAGKYKAYATIVAKEEYQTSDYIVSGGVCDYEIKKINAVVKPKETEKKYNGEMQYIEEFTVSGVLDGQTYEADTNIGRKDVGVQLVTAENMIIYSRSVPKKDVTDNYNITYQSANLEITKKEVKINGIVAESKVYDGNQEAALDVDEIVFDGIVEGDILSLQGVQGSFESASAGKEKRVNLTLSKEMLSGISAKNYDLNIEESQKTAIADIEKKSVTVYPKSVETVYGEEAAFAAEYDGFIGGDSESVISGDVIYHAVKGTTDFSKYSGIGEYHIRVDVSQLTAANHSFVPGVAEGIVLNVKKRPITVEASNVSNVTKEYDASNDGTEAVSPEDYTFKGTLETAPGVVNGDEVNLSYEATYNSSEVDEADHVTLRDLTIDNPNYELKTETFEIPATITKKSLVVTADNKTITYGQSKPTYTVSYSGFEGTDNKSVLGGDLQYACEYDTGVEGNRGVGEYDITPSGYESGNYLIEYKKGKLTVSKALLTISADNKQVVYGEAGEAFTSTVTGYKYGDDFADSVNGNINYDCDRAITSIVGDYGIEPLVDGLQSDNYYFETVLGTLEVQSKTVTISGIQAENKVYDGKKDAVLNLSEVVIEGRISEDASHGITATGAFENAKAENQKRVVLTISLDEYMAKRYVISSVPGESQTETTADISKAPLTVEAVSKKIPYGSIIPYYGVTYTGFKNNETKSVLGGVLGFICNYKTYSKVGEYAIKAYGYTSDNYEISYRDGMLTVEKTALSEPDPVWSEETPGTVSWNAVSKIGDVAVENYVVKLYSGEDSETPLDIKTTAETSVDYLDIIKNAGAGKYYVTVEAVPSETENAEKKNVGNSAVATSDYIWAANVTVSIASDKVSTEGVSAISIDGGSSALMVAGEIGVGVTAELVNNTGYSVASWKADTDKAEVTNLSTNETVVSGTVALAHDFSASQVDLELTLSSTPATLKTEVTADKNSVVYGYLLAMSPNLSITIDKEEADNVEKEEYTYSYQWQQRNPNNTYSDVEGALSENYQFPAGKGVGYYTYRCKVTATRKDNGEKKVVNSEPIVIHVEKASYVATVSLNDWRYGNARSIPQVEGNQSGSEEVAYYYSDSIDGEYTTDMPTDVGHYYIYAVIPTSENFLEVTTPKSEFEIMQTSLATPTGLGWKQSAEEEKGTIYWNAVEPIEENAGAEGCQSRVDIEYTIELYRDEIKTETITGVKDTEIGISSYVQMEGEYTFKVKANSSLPENCTDSSYSELSEVILLNRTIFVEDNIYEKVYDGEPIVLQIEPEEKETYQWCYNGETIDGETGSQCSVTDVKQSGYYQCRIEKEGKISYSGYKEVIISKAEQKITASDATFTYDGTAYGITGAATDGDGTISYEGNDKVKAGEYPVKVKASETDNYLSAEKTVSLKIEKKNLTITAGSAIQDYNGIPLSEESYEKTDLAVGDRIEDIVITGSQTNAGQSANVASDVLIKNSIEEDVTDCYEISYINGSLKVERVAANLVITGNPEKQYDKTAVIDPDVTKDGDGTVSYVYYTKENDSYTKLDVAPSDRGTYYVKAFVTQGTNHNADETDYKEFEIRQAEQIITAAGAEFTYDGLAHSITNATSSGDGEITYEGNEKIKVDNYEVIIRAAETNNYLPAEKKVSLKITKKPLTITAESGEQDYTGTPFVKDDYTSSDLAEGDRIVSVTISGSQTEVGESANTSSDAIIQNALEEDVTDCYDIDYVDGTLTVKMIQANLMITSDLSKTYDGSAVVNPSVTKDGDGEVSYKYYQMEDNEYKELAENPKNAGDYYVKAFVTMGTNHSAGETDYKSFTIERATQEITVSGAEFTYDGLEHSITGATTSADGEISYVGNGQVKADEYEVVVKASQTMNYKEAETKVTLKINPKELTITAGSNSKTYNGEPLSEDSFINSELANGDTIETVTVIGSQTNAGESANRASAAVIKNTSGEIVTDCYDINYTDGLLTVERAEENLVITTNPGKTYDKAAVVNPSVKKEGDGEVSYRYYTKEGENYMAMTSAPENAGTYYVKAFIEQGTNYLADETDYTEFVIERAAQELTVSGATFTYDGTAHSITGAVTSGDGVISYEGNGQSRVDEYDVIVRASETMNYNSAEKQVKLIIERRPLTITAGSKEKQFDGTSLTKKDYTVSGLAVGDSVDEITVEGSQTVVGSSSNVATDAIIRNTGGEDVTSNYNINYQPGTLKVTEAETLLRITEDVTKEYDGEEVLTPEYECSREDEVQISFYSSDKQLLEKVPVKAGTYYVKAAIEAKEYYKGAETELIPFEVTKKSLTITAASAAKVYDGLPATNADYESTEMADGDTIKTVLVEGSQTNAGRSENRASDVVIENTSGENVTDSYDISYIAGSLEVSQAEDTLLITNTLSKRYDGKPVSAPQISRKGNGALTIVYYSAQRVRLASAPTELGNYFVQVFEGASLNYKAAQTALISFAITKPLVLLDQAPPDIKRFHTTPAKYADSPTGKVTGTLPTMEYSKDNGKTWSICTGTVIANAVPGSYLIRYKATETRKASPYVTISVTSKNAELYIPTIVMSKTLGYKKKFQMKLLNTKKAKITCYSSNKKVATVNKKGIIKTKAKKGKTKIVINIIKGNHKVQYVLNVKTSKSVKKNYSLVKFKTSYKSPSVSLYKLLAKSKKYRIQLKNVSKKAKITYKSAQKKIASVSKKGVVKGRKVGKANVVITVKESGMTYKYFMVIRVAQSGKESNTSYLKVLK